VPSEIAGNLLFARLAPDFRIDAPCGRQVGFGPRPVAFFVLGNTAIVQGGVVIRIELDRLVVVLDGAVVLTFFAVGDAAIVEGYGRFFPTNAPRPLLAPLAQFSEPRLRIVSPTEILCRPFRGRRSGHFPR
jgi:hypothetical protein